VTPAPEPAPDRTLFDERGRARPENTLVAVVDGRPAGLVALAASTPLASNRHVLEICLLAVEPARQRRGVGRALVEAAVAGAAIAALGG
jgi:putative acetyltransferase